MSELSPFYSQQLSTNKDMERGVHLYACAEFHKLGLAIFRLFGLLSNLSRWMNLSAYGVEQRSLVLEDMFNKNQILIDLGNLVLDEMNCCVVAINESATSSDPDDDINFIINSSNEFSHTLQDMLSIAEAVVVAKRDGGVADDNSTIPDAGDIIDSRILAILKTIETGCSNIRKTIETIKSTMSHSNFGDQFLKSTHADGGLIIYWPNQPTRQQP